MTQPLSLGFIGGGLSSAVGTVHYCASSLDGRWQLDAGAFSRSIDVNRQTGREWGVDSQRIYDDWQQMILHEKENLDAVAVLTHTPQHIDAIQFLLENYVPVICEKSVVMNAKEASLIQQQMTKSSHFFASIFNYTGYPLIRELKAKIQRGDLGKIQQIHIEMPQEGFSRPPMVAGRPVPPQAWRLQDGNTPLICLDLGTHMVHMLRFLTGEKPNAVISDFANYSQYPGVVDYGSFMLRFKSGMKGNLWITKTALGHRNGLLIRVYGDKASASWQQTQPEELYIAHANGKKEIIDRGGELLLAKQLRYNRMKPGHPAGFIEAFANLYADIADALMEYNEKGHFTNPYVFSFDDAKEGLDFFDAAVKSNEKGAWCSIV